MTTRYRVIYDIDRGGMPGDTVTVVVWANGRLDAVRHARRWVPRATDCIERIRPSSIEEMAERRPRGHVESVTSDLFGSRR